MIGVLAARRAVYLKESLWGNGWNFEFEDKNAERCWFKFWDVLFFGG